MTVAQWSTTAGLNVLSSGTSGTGGVNIDEGMAPSGVNNAMRDILAQIATFITAATFTGTSPVTLTSTDAGATAAPILTLYRNSASPAAADIIGQVLFQGEDSAGNTEDYAAIDVQIDDPTSTSEDATIRLRAKVAGAMTTVATFSGARGLNQAPRGHIHGLTLSNNATDGTNDIDVAIGEAASTDSNPQLMVLASALTKRLDANWAAGTNQGMRNSAAAITDTTYHIYLVAKAGGADVDIYAHTSATVSTVLTALQAETGGSAYIYARRIGSVIRLSSTILGFSQKGDEFLYQAPRQVINNTGPGTTAQLYLFGVPLGIKVYVKFKIIISTSADTAAVLITSPDIVDTAPDSNGINTILQASSLTAGITQVIDTCRTDTSGQVRARASVASIDVFIVTNYGWYDDRDRSA